MKPTPSVTENKKIGRNPFLKTTPSQIKTKPAVLKASRTKPRAKKAPPPQNSKPLKRKTAVLVAEKLLIDLPATALVIAIEALCLGKSLYDRFQKRRGV